MAMVRAAVYTSSTDFIRNILAFFNASITSAEGCRGSPSGKSLEYLTNATHDQTLS